MSNPPRPASLGAVTVWPLSDPAPTSRLLPCEEVRPLLPVSMVKAPPQPRSRPPPDPPPCKLSAPFESVTPSEPPDPPDPPDAVVILSCLPFVDEPLYTSPHMVTKVVDLESTVSDMEAETTGGAFLGVSKRQVLFCAIRSPDSGVFNLSLPSHDVAVSSSPSFRIVKTGSEPCSVFKNQLLRVFTGWFPPLYLSPLLYIGRSKPSTSFSPIFWVRMETNHYGLRLVPRRSVWLQPYHVCGNYLSLTTTQHNNFTELSFTSSVLQGTWSFMVSLIKNDEKRLGLVSTDLWTQHGNVGGWSPCLNSTTAYPSHIIKFISQGCEVKVSHFSTKPRTVTENLVFMESTSYAHSNECSRTKTQGKFLSHQGTLVDFPSPLSNQDSIHRSSSSSLSRAYATVSLSFLLYNMISGPVEIHLVSRIIIINIEAVFSFSRSIAKAWIFTGQSGTSKTRGSTTHDTGSCVTTPAMG
ncbi:unnamed protein product [Eruca vesicaria subsp. sativa]|uniref:Uncharacterized protein n=1 Tax=Eruca vesicaria subsp. sativa TaxID=29727 RepID=A0ABC8M0V1_ERUVS|nr:unnamed protein product [Eruca vesicaria subsp. sativa]